jgi:hypothetical protein
MKNINLKLTLWLGLLAICLLPAGVRASDQPQSGIIGFVESPYWSVEAYPIGSEYPTFAQADQDGLFELDLKPGKYSLTPFTFQAPIGVPGQPTPNFITIIQGPSKTVTVVPGRFRYVLLPTTPNTLPIYIGHLPRHGQVY